MHKIYFHVSLATTTNGDEQNEVNGNHHIELLAREQLEPSDNEQAPDETDQKASNGATDEELTPLHWLHDNNLLKGKTRANHTFNVDLNSMFFPQESICHVKCNHLMMELRGIARA